MEAQGFFEDKENSCIEFCGDDYLKATKNADCIVVMTEWDEFLKYNYKEITQGMS